MRRAVPDAHAVRFRASLTAAALLASAAISPAAQALDRSALAEIALGDASAKQKAIDAAVAAGDLQAAPILTALLEGRLYVEGGKRVLIAVGDGWIDPLTQKSAEPPAADDLEKVSINNRMRRGLELALAALALAAPAAGDRLAAARSLQDASDEAVLPAVDLALRRETDPFVAEALREAAAVLALSSSDRARRLAAIGQLRRAPSTRNKRLLLQRLGQGENDPAAEKDPAVRAELERALDSIDASLRLANLAGLVFGGLSLGSILLLAALGLAITFGLMGVINMAHGELLMIGAYATWLVQGVFRRHLPGLFSWYLLAAVPAAFVAAGLVGMLLEVAVVRKLYGRPLETLLATWGASLLLIQAVRTLFGAQNVEVANPPWMSGGIPAMSGLVLPYNRLAILAFAVLVVLAMWLLLTRTRLGLLVRAVTQNRAMAASLGVATPRVDLLAFALGSGLAGLGGCALSQIGNVGPELGQGFIVDSFMVVVLGGVGQLAGTIAAALGLGQVNKLLEPTAGAVMAKIAVLVFVILFIQRRPQGLFAQRGRSSEEGQGE
jgi:urea transport system permease protein